MITIRLKDGKEKEFESAVSLADAAKAISNSLGKNALVAKVNGELTDLRDPIVDGAEVEFFTKEDPEGLFTLRHTASHVMAQAIQQLFPGVKFAIGPAIDDGFYYDLDSDHVFSQEDFAAIEKEMSKIAKENIPLVKKVLPRDEALQYFKDKGQDYKGMLIEDLPEDLVDYIKRTFPNMDDETIMKNADIFKDGRACGMRMGNKRCHFRYDASTKQVDLVVIA